MSAFKRILNLLLLLALGFGALGLNVQPALAGKNQCSQYYTVKSGDTLAKIARKFKVSQASIKKLNGMSSEDDFNVGDKLCVSDSDTDTTTAGVDAKWSGGKVWASKVVEDTNATIKASGLPSGVRFDILMGKAGGAAASYKAGSATSNGKGTFETTVKIPKKLVDTETISLRLRSGGYIYAVGSFENSDSGSSSSTSGDLTLQITSVDEGNSVSIKATDFPTNKKFYVYMAERKSKNQDFTKVETFTTGKKTSFTDTYTIPDELADADEITLKLESSDGKYEVSVNFDNDTSAANDTDEEYITVLDVSRDSEVEAKFTNLAAGVRYNVYIGTASSKGSDGVKVGTIKSSNGAAVTKTFTIPSSMRGKEDLAIRIESSKGTAYVKFDND